MAFEKTRAALAANMAAAAPASAASRGDAIETALTTLEDQNAAPADRLASFMRLNAATFVPTSFAPFHARYDALLHTLATDPQPDIRAIALERLALAGDMQAHQLLVDGLEGRISPLVPDAKAVMLLGSNDHTSARPLLRRLAETATGETREEAVRALAHDPKSAPLFEALMTDKTQPAPLRSTAALSLRATSPARFARVAQKLVLDADDDDDLRATAMSAVAHTEEVRDRLNKAKFNAAVERVGESTASDALKASIQRFRVPTKGGLLP